MQVLFNDGWRFARTKNGSLPAPQDFAPVSLPHDWLIQNADNLYEDGDGWYMRALHVPDAKDGKCRILRFDGVYMDCEVLLNGGLVCAHRYGYTAFDADLTAALRSGNNELLVHVRHLSPNSRWYSGAGIYRDVVYMEFPACHIVPDGIYVHTQRCADEWLVHIQTEITGNSLGLQPVHRLLDRSGTCIAEGNATLRVSHPMLWSCEHPYCYTLETQFGGETIRQNVGFREFTFDPDNGLFVNGVHTKLHGVCLHHDLGALGAAFHEKAARRQLQLMKDMGVNALRTAHNPPARQVMDLCDEMGILVVSEAFDMWERPKTAYDYARFFPECEAEDVRSWVRRDRNHPSLLMWSIGNEILDTHIDARGQQLTHMLAAQVREHDPYENGAITLGLNYLPWENAQKCVDIIKNGGYNYAEKLYEPHHKQYPDWVIYGSETASLVQSRGVYHFPADTPILAEADLQCSALGNSLTSWGTKDIRKLIVDDLTTPYSMGQFLWCGIDYIGEPTPYHTRSSYFGFADTAGFPKDLYYLFRAAWQSQFVLHIGVHWDWNVGQMIDVNVMTNAHAVELLVNGRSLGTKTVSFADASICLPCWRVAFEPGEITVRAYDAHGTCIGETTRRTPGDSRRLVLRAQDNTLLGNGHDMTFVEISAVDAQGNPVDNACDRVTVRVQGGVLLGLDNGDSTDRDGYKTDSRRLFSGKLLAMVGASREAGELVVTVCAPGLEGAVLRIPVLPTGTIPGRGCAVSCPESNVTEPVHARRIELTAQGSTQLGPQNREVRFTWRTLPHSAMEQPITWQVTNAAGIDAGCATLETHEDHVTVRALGDGVVYLRAMCHNGYDHARVLSQMEITIDGLGTPNLDPYGFVAGGLYALHSGEISPGNDKGIAFARDGRSMAGFTNVDFGPDGSDEITLPIFALDGNPYELEMYLGNPDEGAALFARLPYQKPSRWNVYQSETYKLPQRITGMQTICFVMHKKIHLKGFSFAKQSRAFLPLSAAQADAIYGDSFTRDGSAIRSIGNNVSLVFERMDYGVCRKACLALSGSTPLSRNPITVRIQRADGEETTQIAEFVRGTDEQCFMLDVPGGMCTVTFVFLPGSQFDFERFWFEALGDSTGHPSSR
ncbi:MAG: glycoside hydrolase family 2 protein [Clostridiales bacterium]|nr:glycoside hydrolase family 2 protein [Clostridiales bacterium]